MTPTESPEELRKRANEILKGVDQLIKAGKLEEALKEIMRAKVIDPNNAYIYAFEERISFLRGEEQRKRGAEVARKQMEETARQKLDDQRRRVEEERKRKEEEARKRFEEDRLRKADEARRLEEERKRKALEVVQPKASDERQKIEEATKRKFEEDFRKAEEENRKKAAPAPTVAAPNDPRSIYKSVLLLAWADGALTKEEEAQLSGMRASLAITPDDDKKLALEAQLESYAQAFKLAWTTGLDARERATVVTELRKKFRISSTDQPKIEAKVLAEIDPTHHQPTIFVIEDEDAVLKLIVKTLENSGFAVQAFTTSDEAYDVLREGNGRVSPDLIVSDIALETSSMGGFSFYEKVRLIDRLNNIPFVFLSGLTDEGMIRYGKALGADDYITKPFSNDMLLDTIKGKLKRFQKFRRN
ncbi:MAG TPA: hypothetical protein DCP63_11295 [Bacteroidetes bacterium]|nr:hypothetical protein [Bacteroidota bacterium]